MQHLKEIVLPNYPLVLSLLKYRNVWVFWNKKKSGSNRYNPLNSSIEYRYFLGNVLVVLFFVDSVLRGSSFFFFSIKKFKSNVRLE